VSTFTKQFFELNANFSLMRDAADEERRVRDERERQEREKQTTALEIARTAQEKAERETLTLQHELKLREVQITSLNQRFDDADKLHKQEIINLKTAFALQIEQATAPLKEKIAALEATSKKTEELAA